MPDQSKGQAWAKRSADNLVARLRHELEVSQCAVADANATIAHLQLDISGLKKKGVVADGTLSAALTTSAGNIRDLLSTHFQLIQPASRNLGTALGMASVRELIKTARQGLLLKDLQYVAVRNEAFRHLTPDTQCLATDLAAGSLRSANVACKNIGKSSQPSNGF